MWMEVMISQPEFFTLDNLHFASGQSTILKNSYSELKELLEYLKLKPNTRIEIAGHTDSDGDEAYNLRLSDNRCQSVRRKLKQLLSKFGTYKFETKAYGETRPRVENSSDENKQINRRVEVMVFPPKDYYDSLPDN